MPMDPCLATLVRRDWLEAGPLGHLIDPYIGALRGQRYGERTIRGYVGCLAHFCHWMACDAIAWSAPEAVSLIERFLRDHLPTWLRSLLWEDLLTYLQEECPNQPVIEELERLRVA